MKSCTQILICFLSAVKISFSRKEKVFVVQREAVKRDKKISLVHSKSFENKNTPMKQELLLSATVVVLCTHFKSISTAIVLCSILKPTVVLRTMYVC